MYGCTPGGPPSSPSQVKLKTECNRVIHWGSSHLLETTATSPTASSACDNTLQSFCLS